MTAPTCALCSGPLKMQSPFVTHRTGGRVRLRVMVWDNATSSLWRRESAPGARAARSEANCFHESKSWSRPSGPDGTSFCFSFSK